MSDMTIAKTRDNLSAIIAELERGEISEHRILNRTRAVAKIVPIDDEAPVPKRIGVAKGDPAFEIDDDLFDELDAEIADLFEV